MKTVQWTWAIFSFLRASCNNHFNLNLEWKILQSAMERKCCYGLKELHTNSLLVLVKGYTVHGILAECNYKLLTTYIIPVTFISFHDIGIFHIWSYQLWLLTGTITDSSHINRSLNWQHQLCKNPRPNPDIKTLFVDHTCGQPNGARAPSPANNPLLGSLPKAGGFPPLGAHGVSH